MRRMACWSFLVQQWCHSSHPHGMPCCSKPPVHFTHWRRQHPSPTSYSYHCTSTAEREEVICCNPLACLQQSVSQYVCQSDTALLPSHSVINRFTFTSPSVCTITPHHNAPLPLPLSLPLPHDTQRYHSRPIRKPQHRTTLSPPLAA